MQAGEVRKKLNNGNRRSFYQEPDRNKGYNLKCLRERNGITKWALLFSKKPKGLEQNGMYTQST